MSGFFEATAFLYDPRGRCSRKGLLIVLGITLALQIALGMMIWKMGLPFTGGVATGIKLVFVWIALSATSQRLHDMGLSGWWIPAAIVALIVWWTGVSVAAFLLMQAGTITTSNASLLALVCVFYLPIIAAAAWLHCAKGAAGENRYGPAPDESGFSYRRAERDEGAHESDALPA